MQATRPDSARSGALFTLTLTLSLPLAGLSGCADSTLPKDPFDRVGVSGTVSLDGAPLTIGTIQLDPAGETKGPQTSAEIADGKFAIARPQGPVAGKYKVSISGRPPAKIDSNAQPGGTPKVKPDPVPAKYNARSTLETEIPAGGSSALEFALKK